MSGFLFVLSLCIHVRETLKPIARADQTVRWYADKVVCRGRIGADSCESRKAENTMTEHTNQGDGPK